jgi:hypothetical protein
MATELHSVAPSYLFIGVQLHDKQRSEIQLRSDPVDGNGVALPSIVSEFDSVGVALRYINDHSGVALRHLLAASYRLSHADRGFAACAAKESIVRQQIHLEHQIRRGFAIDFIRHRPGKAGQGDLFGFDQISAEVAQTGNAGVKLHLLAEFRQKRDLVELLKPFSETGEHQPRVRQRKIHITPAKAGGRQKAQRNLAAAR